MMFWGMFVGEVFKMRTQIYIDSFDSTSEESNPFRK